VTLLVDSTDAERLQATVRGQVLLPGDAGYDDARRVWNALVDRRPAVIVRCFGTEDVVRGIEFARERGLELSVRGSGHNVSGCAVCDGGVTLDLSALKGVLVDPSTRTARAGAGTTWGELDAATQEFGLGTTGARISTTGIGGVTLGGGYGWLMRSCGLSADNLVGAEVVTAAGEVVTAGATENPELLWGLRGGGGNFGVVTRFAYRLHALPEMVTCGVLYYPGERAREVLAFHRELMATAPDELCVMCSLVIAPPAPFVPAHLQGARVAAFALCHSGSPRAAERDLARVRALGQPLLDRVKPRPYTAAQRMLDAAGRFGKPVHGRSGHLTELSDAAIETLASHATGITSDLSVVMVSPLGGAVARVGEEDTAFSHRQAPADWAVDSVWRDPGEAERHVRWTDELAAAMRPHTSGAYVNELVGDADGDVRSAYSAATWSRLAALKAVYDPDNVFHLNRNVAPLGKELA
jgi:FAD/FMN-containing dehydrogenase